MWLSTLKRAECSHSSDMFVVHGNVCLGWSCLHLSKVSLREYVRIMSDFFSLILRLQLGGVFLLLE